ncbi:hypothetical protein [Leeuwenhoekiella marinoflava]|uniref:Uncharacterized protein n=2 Tax=Leeuwenhoekiella marinoflava TaxID=988 RepID=A0A4Q0PNN2_9FLAO|nr:hypothetical protein [Leeuwenhoekiella marinoflava]RXG32034.1 hypothetical protein DSL99_1339 [Leeuwenhoekiella marinoflava]SHE95672.1 hypothetical protein SAMN02745246_01394 [Leeuwenhoekiella marinoflava DSM 3653]
MGIAIGTTIANASDQGLGNIFLNKQYISRGGITDADTIAALETFEAALRSKGLINRLSKIFLQTGKASSDAIDFLNPANTDFVYENDEATDHTKALGYTSSSSEGKYVSNSGSTIPLPVDTMHFHAYNTTPDTEASPAQRLIRVAIGNDFLVELIRNQSGRTLGVIGLYTSDTEGLVRADVGYDTTKTGLLSVVRQTTSVKLYDGGVEIGSKSVTPFTGNAPAASKIDILNSFDSNIPNISMRAFAWGSGEWTPQNEEDFKDALNALNNALSV